MKVQCLVMTLHLSYSDIQEKPYSSPMVFHLLHVGLHHNYPNSSEMTQRAEQYKDVPKSMVVWARVVHKEI